MPYVIRPRIRTSLRRLGTLSVTGALAATATLAAGSTAAAASPSAGSCPSRPATQPFAAFGDTNPYRLAPGGAFEGRGVRGWRLTGARVVAGNEPWHVTGHGGDRSLSIAAGGTAVSPVFCVDASMPSLRFFARQTAAGGGLQVTVVAASSHRAPGARASVGAIADGSQPAWAPTARLPLATTLGLSAGEHVLVRLRFRVPRGGGHWQIDDVLLDPYRVADGA